MVRLQTLLDVDPNHPHVHRIDMPFRLTSNWQDKGCEIGIWQAEEKLLAWAVFQPPWSNFDYALQPSEWGSSLEEEILIWGKQQIQAYLEQTGQEGYKCVEFFEDRPKAEQTVYYMEQLEFKELDWSIPRFAIDLNQDLPQPLLPTGFSIRPFQGKSEVDAYVKLFHAVFAPEGLGMIADWRLRTLEYPTYQRDIDFVVVSPEDQLVGFCGCWMWQQLGQLEPLAIHPEYQRQGLGTALELKALQGLRNQGAKLAYIDHGSNNQKAFAKRGGSRIALSLKNGFRQVNNAQRYFIKK